MIEDGIKTDRIVSFAILKENTQAIQKGSGSGGEKKNEEDASAIVVGQRVRSRRPRRRRSQGHSIEKFLDLKREIENMIQDGSIMVKNIDSEENSSHADMQTSG
ncbi:hypothetical protein T459_11478 [Capsicum annuum]|uniref:Uncharacterized protein n=1 Tax=Capsicum annuum TaxID=4072 RepID=A0A2G2ZM64_CAPAN|nr:hypothetical protein T459_11478 [Capsicum annuum]